MDADAAERVYSGARAMLERFKTQYGAHALPQEIAQIQDLLEMVERNADRIAHMLKRKRASGKWDDVKALLVEQDRFFREIAEVFTQLSHTRIVLGGAARAHGAP